jgi:hypothetical protein
MTRAESARLFAVISGAFPHVHVTDDTRDIYVAMLGDLDVKVANEAVRKLLATAKFMPTIAEIRAKAAELVHGPRLNGGEAWGAIVEAIQRVGSYRPAPRFTDPLVGECVKLMGWKNLCLGENDAADRARFIQLYDQLSQQQRTETVSSPGLAQVTPMKRLPAFTTARALAAEPPTRQMTELEKREVLATTKPLAPKRLLKPMSVAELEAAMETAKNG